MGKTITNKYLNFYDGKRLVLFTEILFDLNYEQQIATHSGEELCTNNTNILKILLDGATEKAAKGIVWSELQHLPLT